MASTGTRSNRRGRGQVFRGNSSARGGGRSIGNNPVNEYLSSALQAPFYHSNSVLRTAAWGHATSVPELLPRSSEDLHLERAYLVDSARQQNHNVTQLLRRIRALEEKPSQHGLQFVRRKTKKNIGWLKCQLEEVTQQEQSILARLGQLTYEIQARERWALVDQERRQHDMQQQEQFFDYQQGLHHGMQQLQRMQLNSAQQEIQPRGYFSPLYQTPEMEWPDWQRQGFVGQFDVTDPTYASPTANDSPDSGEVSPTNAEGRDYFLAGANSLYKSTASQRSASTHSVEIRLLSTNTVNTLAPAHKRHSFPSLPGHSDIWQPTATEQAAVDASETEIEDGGYVGFYVKQTPQVGDMQE